MKGSSIVAGLLSALLVVHCASAQDGDGRADAERMLQAYLSMWSDDANVTAGTIDRFYAPQVSYYGQALSRAAVLADKRAFVRAYPGRSYREVPGTFSGSCDADRSRCRVTAVIDYRRTDRRGVVTSGRVRLGFDFVPAEGGRKIAREEARPLPSGRG